MRWTVRESGSTGEIRLALPPTAAAAAGQVDLLALGSSRWRPGRRALPAHTWRRAAWIAVPTRAPVNRAAVSSTGGQMRLTSACVASRIVSNNLNARRLRKEIQERHLSLLLVLVRSTRPENYGKVGKRLSWSKRKSRLRPVS